MQKRFCVCGQQILVRYLCRKGEWQPLVISGKKADGKRASVVCPTCGSPLSIHTLR